MRARKVDANLKSIVDAARKLGLLVNVRNDDCADLDVQVRGSNVSEIWEVKFIQRKIEKETVKIINIKTAKVSKGVRNVAVYTLQPSDVRYTKRQKKLRAAGWCIRLVTCVDDVLAAKQTMLADAEAIRKARLLQC